LSPKGSLLFVLAWDHLVYHVLGHFKNFHAVLGKQQLDLKSEVIKSFGASSRAFEAETRLLSFRSPPSRPVNGPRYSAYLCWNITLRVQPGLWIVRPLRDTAAPAGNGLLPPFSVRGSIISPIVRWLGAALHSQQALSTRMVCLTRSSAGFSALARFFSINVIASGRSVEWPANGIGQREIPRRHSWLRSAVLAGVLQDISLRNGVRTRTVPCSHLNSTTHVVTTIICSLAGLLQGSPVSSSRFIWLPEHLVAWAVAGGACSGNHFCSASAVAFRIVPHPPARTNICTNAIHGDASGHRPRSSLRSCCFPASLFILADAPKPWSQPYFIGRNFPNCSRSCSASRVLGLYRSSASRFHDASRIIWTLNAV